MIKKFIAALLALFAAAAFAAVDVNKADQAALESVKGIGPAISTKILDARKTGSFKDWPDFITRVKGVGDGNAAKFSAEGLTVNDAPFSGAAPAAAKASTPAKTATPATAAPSAATVTLPAASSAPGAAKTSKASTAKTAAAATPDDAASKPMTKAEAKAAKKAQKAAAAASAASAAKK